MKYLKKDAKDIIGDSVHTQKMLLSFNFFFLKALFEWTEKNWNIKFWGSIFLWFFNPSFLTENFNQFYM